MVLSAPPATRQIAFRCRQVEPIWIGGGTGGLSASVFFHRREDTGGQAVSATQTPLFATAQARLEVFAVEPGNIGNGNCRGTGGLAFLGHRAAAESFAIHLCNHRDDTASALGVSLRQKRQVRN